MKILFVITGIGLGHSIREEAVIQELTDKKMVDVRIAGFGTSYNYFKNKYKCHRILGHRFYGTRNKTRFSRIFFENILYPFYFLIDVFLLLMVIARFNPDIVIVDAEPPGIIAGKLMRKKTFTIYDFDLKILRRLIGKRESPELFLYYLIARIFYSISDKVIIPVVGRKSRDYGNIRYVNPMVRRISDKSSKARLMKKLGISKEPILVTIGGSSFGNNLVSNLIKISKYFDEDFLVLGIKNKGNNNVRCYNFKNNFLDYLRVSKAVICLAGHNTLSEVFVYNKAALVFPIENYVEHDMNLEAVKGYVVVGNKISNKSLIKSINSLLEQKKDLEKKLKKLKTKGNGASQVVDLIENEIG